MGFSAICCLFHVLPSLLLWLISFVIERVTDPFKLEVHEEFYIFGIMRLYKV